MNKLADLAIATSIIRKLATPLSKTKDNTGYVDRVCNNIKKLLAKLPGGSSKVATIAAAMMLLKEHNLTEDNWESMFYLYYDKAVNLKLQEDGAMIGGGAAVNSAGSGDIQGIGIGPKGEPGVTPRKKNKYRAANKAAENTITKSLRRVLGEDETVPVNSSGGGDIASLGVIPRCSGGGVDVFSEPGFDANPDDGDDEGSNKVKVHTFGKNANTDFQENEIQRYHRVNQETINNVVEKYGPLISTKPKVDSGEFQVNISNRLDRLLHGKI
jgi:hypothetical protein